MALGWRHEGGGGGLGEGLALFSSLLCFFFKLTAIALAFTDVGTHYSKVIKLKVIKYIFCNCFIKVNGKKALEQRLIFSLSCFFFLSLPHFLSLSFPKSPTVSLHFGVLVGRCPEGLRVAGGAESYKQEVGLSHAHAHTNTSTRAHVYPKCNHFYMHLTDTQRHKPHHSTHTHRSSETTRDTFPQKGIV